MNEPARVPKTASLVAAAIRRRIMAGQLQEGDALPNESELMSHYEVSRPTMREALRILESEALVSIKRGVGGGARIRYPDISVTARHAALLLRVQGTTFEDIFTARMIIEPAAVRLLAAKARADPAILDPLRAIYEESMAVFDDRRLYAGVASRFHEQVIELAGNRSLALMGRILMDIAAAHNRMAIAIMTGHVQDLERAQRDHLRLLDSLEKGDEETAARLWTDHLHDSMRVVLSSLGSERLDTIELFD